MDRARIVTKTWIACIIEFLVLILLLFGVAGRWDWYGAWAWLALLLVVTVVATTRLVRHDPELLAERMKSPIQKEQKSWDKVLLSILLLVMVVWMPLMALDAGRFRWSEMPIWLQVFGAFGTALSMYIIYLTFRANTFLAPVVKIQSERGHHVVSSGPYAVVRHPMYAGALLLFASTGLLMGSWLGVLVGIVLIVLLIARTILEDRTLTEELPGYREYASRVPFKLIPRVF